MNNPDPHVSVIVSLVDHREEAIPCLTSLAREQNASPESFEIIVVSDGTEPDMDQRISQILRVQDQLLIESSRNEYRLFNTGARAALGDVLIIIESHCVADAAFVKRFIEAFQNPELIAARCRTVGVAKSPLEHFERELFENSFEVGLKETCWNRVLIHGFGIRRKTFLEDGGFREKSENFGPWELGARLHRRGVNVAYLEGAVVHHRYMGEKDELRDFIVRFCLAEWEYQVNGEQDLIRSYFPRIPDWDTQGQSCRKQAKAVFGSRSGITALFRMAVKTPPSVFMKTLRSACNRIFYSERARESQLRLISDLAWAEAEELEQRDLFINFWKRCVDLGRWKALCHHASHRYQDIQIGIPLAAEDIDQRSLYGWGEINEKDRSRWVEPLSGISVKLPPSPVCLILNLASKTGATPLQMHVAGKVIKGRIFKTEGESICFDFPSECSTYETLVFVSPATVEPETGNLLGMLLKSISVEASAMNGR
ncbi:MAG: glycosyltransferase family 2 protein [Verrucomicrobiales bacterium]|nr:glycosyltransferase family 2 protein [Verrucomicrobiales bacterium]